MERPSLKLVQILDTLEKTYGPQKVLGPTDPYEAIVFLNCGYPATDESCAKGFDALVREVGISPKKLLAASKTKLGKLMRLGGIVPEQRAERLKEIARRVKNNFGGDLGAALQELMQDGKSLGDKGL